MKRLTTLVVVPWGVAVLLFMFGYEMGFDKIDPRDGHWTGIEWVLSITACAGILMPIWFMVRQAIIRKRHV